MKKFLILALLAILITPALGLPDLEDQLKGDAYIRNAGAPWLDDDAVLYFGRDKDGSLKFNSTSGYLEMVGLTAYDNTSITVESGEDITFAGGDSKIDLSAGSGLWKMPLGQGTIGGATDFNGAITCRDVTLDNNYNITQGGTGTLTTGTGAVTLAGDSTVSTNKALAVTTADKLTVGGVIIPQEMAVPFSYNANSVDIGIFSAKGAWNITAVELVPRVAGNDAGAVNVTIKVCDSGEAPSSGEAALSAVLNLKGTADTTQSGTLGSNVACTATQFIALDFSGTLTNAVGMGTVWLKRV